MGDYAQVDVELLPHLVLEKRVLLTLVRVPASVIEMPYLPFVGAASRRHWLADNSVYTAANRQASGFGGWTRVVLS